MKNFTFTPQGVCSRQMMFELDDNGKLHDVQVIGGCPGNLSALSKLLEGYDAKQAVTILKGNQCGKRGTSCMDQFAQAVEKALAE